ncbi:nucleotidyl transferase AbiEii/AbiGii toxin family protein [Curvibacter sp. PAE-UM]|uniref:nucleotidyl transferase AbiEii/AbiGii toxin family protein n=1 Tax=Curvibacter sp. PAE-UM TaxID=1714344 RepID=UPI00070EE077|nr:nucleotidyl transferase AbiEii/AbiGii toxin family protein [Curvibacter sp. PAE-UM]KRI01536.1 hypothetical protein AO057_00160 [Curvibacter sp. PAE-UM]
MSKLDLNRPGVWRELWPQALGLMTHLEGMVHQPLWTFGGGTVLMLRHGHRLSKDIDLFVPDPQYLGYVNPRLSDVAEAVSADYEENAEFIKFYLPQGEIDIVVGTALTAQPYEVVKHAGREIKVERSAEIIAKKMWFRGDQAKARDLFDLCAVASLEPAAIAEGSPFFVRHGAAFLHRLQERMALARAEFEAIDALDFQQSFDECLQQAREILGSVLKRRG